MEYEQIDSDAKYLDTEDYFMCHVGIFPAQISDSKYSFITKKEKRHLTHFDTACKGDDFCCKWAVILAVAAAVFCALLATNPVGWAILAGLAIGLLVGMTLCGVMMAMGRTWFMTEISLIIYKEQYAITSDSYMECAIGGQITYQPQIKTPGMAIWTGLRNLGFATLQGVMYGYAGYGIASVGTASGCTAIVENFCSGYAMTWLGYGSAIRGALAFENVLYNDAAGYYDGLSIEEVQKRRNEDFEHTFAAEIFFYKGLYEKWEKGEKITLEEYINAIAIPASLVGLNIHANETALRPSDQIPKPLRNGAEKLLRTRLTPKHLGVKMLKDNPELLDVFNEAMRRLAESRYNNAYKEYMAARNNNFRGLSQDQIQALCENAWARVRSRMTDVAAERGITIDGEIHHYNYPKYDNPYDVLNPNQLTDPLNRADHTAVHQRTTSDPSRPWEGPVRDNARIPVEPYDYPQPAP